MFSEKFNLIEGEKLILKLIETVNGEEAFDLLPYYYYEIIDQDHNRVGKISFRIGYNEYTIFNGNIGYEIDERYRGKGYSFSALMLLKPLIKYHGLNTIFIVVNEDNIASNKIALKKGHLIGKHKVNQNHKFYLNDEEIKNVYLINVNDL